MIAAWVFAGLSALVVGFHLAVILGAPFGPLTQGGRHPGALPWVNRVLAGLSAGLTLAVALAVLSAAGQGPAALADLPRGAGWSGVALGGLALFANLATPSRPERRLWAPVGAVLLASALVVML